MSRLHDRQDKLTITNYLRMAKNAVMKAVKADGTVVEVTTDDIARLDKSTQNTTITSATTLTAADSGKHVFLNSATAFATTLPTEAAGLEFWFHIGATEPTTTHTVVTASSANTIQGNITSPEDAAGSVATVADADTISFVASKALHGDYAHLWCNGTNWFLDGMCKVQDGMTTTQAS